MPTSFPRVAMVVETVPTDSPFLLRKFHEFRRRGWNIDLVCLGGRRGTPDGRVMRRDRRHIRSAWPVSSRIFAAVLLPAAVLTCFARNPVGTSRYLRRAISRFRTGAFRQFYRDVPLICARPDIVHFEFAALAVGRMHVRELLECAVIVSFRGYDANYVGLDSPDYYREVWESSDEIHLLGEDLWRRTISRGCPPSKRHVLIPPGVDIALFQPPFEREAAVLGTAGRPLRIVSVGRLVWKKGYEYALQAVRLLQDRGVFCEYRILGEGEYLEALAFTRHQLGLEDIVQFAGGQSQADVRSHLAWADVFLHAAVSEGFCNAVVEAQAMALPVVSSDADGLSENVLNGETGFVVPRRCPADLADRLQLLAGDGELRRRLGNNARQRAVERFNIADQMMAFEALYRRVAEAPESHPVTVPC